MKKGKLLSTRVALLSVLLLFGHAVAYGQKVSHRQNSLLPDVNLGLGKLGVEAAILAPTAAPQAVLPVLPSLSVPTVSVRMAPPILPGSNVSASVGGGGVSVAVGVDVSGSTLGVNLGDDGIPGAPPAPNFPASGPTLAAQEQLLQQRLALLPTCR